MSLEVDGPNELVLLRKQHAAAWRFLQVRAAQLENADNRLEELDKQLEMLNVCLVEMADGLDDAAGYVGGVAARKMTYYSRRLREVARGDHYACDHEGGGYD